MTSIHTFEFSTALSKKEQQLIKKKLNISNKRENWTEHRYSKKGITIILYKGKRKKFIYLKYIVNLKRIFEENDYLHLLEATDQNISTIWKTIRQTWDEIGCGIPFERFYLSRIDFTCDIYLENEELVQEYIRLLKKGILLSTTQRYSIEGICHKEEIPKDKKEELQQNACKYQITNCEDIQYYNKMYQLRNEDLAIPDNAPSDNNILRIELQVHKTKRISEVLLRHGLYNKPIEEQFAFFMVNADWFLLNRLECLYPAGNYHTRAYIEGLILNDDSIKTKSKDRIMQFVSDCNRQSTLGRCLEIEKETHNNQKRQKSLKYLTAHNINPIYISSNLKDYTELPSIFELIENADQKSI
jgi:hypothetical protein